jgi:hypothetical protein
MQRAPAIRDLISTALEDTMTQRWLRQTWGDESAATIIVNAFQYSNRDLGEETSLVEIIDVHRLVADTAYGDVWQELTAGTDAGWGKATATTSHMTRSGLATRLEQIRNVLVRHGWALEQENGSLDLEPEAELEPEAGDLLNLPGTRNHPNAATHHGSWSAFDHTLADTPREEVLRYLGETASTMHDHDVDKITEEYSDAINAALPEGLSLHGRDVYGPGNLRLDRDAVRDAFRSVDLDEIVQRNAR